MITKNATQTPYFTFFTSNSLTCEYECDNECGYNGQKECNGNGYRTCQQDGNGCLTWSNTWSCDDGDPCTSGDGCQNGNCVAGTPVNCNYLNDQCATGVCSWGNCIAQAKAGPCNDGDICTTGDQCQGTQCLGTPVNCDHLTDQCNTGICQGGGCVAQQKAGGCDDGDPCTISDICSNGNCVSGNPLDCSGLTDSCNTGVCVNGQCTAQQKDGNCDDGDACTQGDACANGACVPGGLMDCTYLTNACYDGVCVVGECQKVSKPGMECDDGIACTVDLCEPDTGCSYTPDASLCDDGNPCTADECLPGAGGCLNTPAPGPCDDGDACTVDDACVEGACSPGTPKECGDDNPCTDDSCVPATGDCVHMPNDLECDDGNACTVLDKCMEALCSGKPLSCDDGFNCTQDFCQPNVGCVHNGQDNLCDDGNQCTSNVCSEVNGCQNPPADGPCNDGDPCTVGDLCAEGVCVAGSQKDCDDANVCTTDWCEEGTGNCIHLGEPGPCDDGNECTVNDSCKDGKCSGELLSDCCFTDEDCVNPTPECLTVSCVAKQCQFEAYCPEGQCGPSPCDEALDCGGCLPFQVCISQWCEDECDLADKDLTQCVSDDKVLEKCLEDPESGSFYWKQTDCVETGESGCAYSQDKGLFVCCTPDCTDKACGMPSDCGVSCGSCGEGEFCCLSGEECAQENADNIFQCLDCCHGLECGQGVSEGCTEVNCGNCGEGLTCKSGTCVSHCEDAGVDEEGTCAGSVAWWCEKSMGKEVLMEVDCADFLATCCFDEELGRAACCTCDEECADNGWECGTNTCGESCGDYDGECAPGFNCVPDTHQCLCQMPDLCYPDVEEPGSDTTTPDAGPGITIPIEEDEGDGGGKKSGGCSTSSATNGAATLLTLLLLLFALVGLTRRTDARR